MKINHTPAIILLYIFLLLTCSKQVQKSAPPEQSQLPDITYTTITLECIQKYNKGYPFVELSLIIENTAERYYIATVYGQIHKTYTFPLPIFAPPHALSGVSIQNNNTMHHFFVCSHTGSETIAVKSLAEKQSENYTNLTNYTTIIKIPVTIHNATKANVIVK